MREIKFHDGTELCKIGVGAVRYGLALLDVDKLGRALAFSKKAYTGGLGPDYSRLYCICMDGSERVETLHVIMGRR